MCLSQAPQAETSAVLHMMAVWSMCVRMDQLLLAIHPLRSTVIVFKQVSLQSLSMLDLAVCRHYEVQKAQRESLRQSGLLDNGGVEQSVPGEDSWKPRNWAPVIKSASCFYLWPAWHITQNNDLDVILRMTNRMRSKRH